MTMWQLLIEIIKINPVLFIIITGILVNLHFYEKRQGY